MPKKPIEKILVITPVEEDRTRICEKLKELQYRCFSVYAIDSISKAIEKEAFHYFIVDIRENEFYSPDILEKITTKNPDSAIVSITSKSTIDDNWTSGMLGIDNVLMIPDELERLQIILAQTRERKKYNQGIRKRMQELERRAFNSEKSLEHSFDIVEQTLVDTIKTFVGLLETRSMHIGSHSKHVGPIARALAEKYNLKERVKRDIEIGGLLHDIGKIGLSDQILTKTHGYFPTVELTNKERQIYQAHTVVGQEAVAMVNVLNQVGLYIRHHHERFDGGGFPDGISGFHIPLGARIINVVNAYEKIVLTVDKKKRKDAEELFVKYLNKHKGTLFDPEASGKMLEYMRELSEKELEAEQRLKIEKLTPGMSLARDVYTKNGVLVISRFEKLTTGEIERLKRFLYSEMIIDTIYIHLPQVNRKVKSKKAPQKDVETRSQEEINYSAVKKSIDTTKEYATLREIHNAVTHFVSEGGSTRDDITDILRRDPVITLKILRIANSPLLGFSGDVVTVEESVKRLGYSEIRHLVSSVPVISEDESESLYLQRRDFWKHQAATGIICRLIGERIKADNLEEYFTAGLLHDIGKLALAQLFHSQYQRVMSLVEKKAIFYRKAERTLFGQTHEVIGAYLMKRWNIPEILADAVQNHHAPMDSNIDPMLASAVHLADIIAHMLHIGESGENTIPKYEPFAQQKLRISLAELELFISDIDDELKRNRELLFQ